jgi:5-methylcytosine-specific restriction endonuclease McrA
MDVTKLSSFISTALDNPFDQWTASGLERIAILAAPDLVMGGREILLRSDIHSLWARWFLEAVCDPERFVEPRFKYAHIYAEAKLQIESIVTNVANHDRNALTRKVAGLLYNEVERRRNRARNRPDMDSRKLLLEIAAPAPHCWICGYRFSREAVNRFLDGGGHLPQLPRFVDYLKPQGLSQRDLSIEIDHVVPIVEGGTDDENLRLACGWCNAAKGGAVFVYDVPASPLKATHPEIGKVTLPRAFWVVRTLAIARRCESERGCTKTVEDGQLTISPMHSKGAMNPTSLRITCPEHDPVRSSRLVPRRAAQSMWNRKGLDASET